MHHHGACIKRVASLDPPQEGQDRGWVLGNPMVWPGHELELTEFPLLTGATLGTRGGGGGLDSGARSLSVPCKPLACTVGCCIPVLNLTSC